MDDYNIFLRTGRPDFRDLPWGLPLQEWEGNCPRLEQVEHGLSRHPVVFVNYDGILYVLKELPRNLAEKEFELLSQMLGFQLPVVLPVGYLRRQGEPTPSSILITRYLEHSIPYRSLFMRSSLTRYREHLLDAMASLLVGLHLVGMFWGDCSLSNTLYRRDAGALRAYLVDAETAEFHPEHLPPNLRYTDLEIMEENVNGDLADLEATGILAEGIPVSDTGVYIRKRYLRLWEEITHEEYISPGEHYRIQERVRALNALGYSVGDIELRPTDSGNQLRLRAVVTDRNFHRNQLLELTGLEAEEMQAQQIMNEIQAIKATLSQNNNRSTPLSVAAYYWLENYYKPTLELLQPVITQQIDPTELYWQVLEHKWFLSERAHHDVGHHAAAEDYRRHFAGTDH
jgi:hypothetical protein